MILAAVAGHTESENPAVTQDKMMNDTESGYIEVENGK
jgi:hypothetical protein